jgi:hypothetical protein
MPIFADERRANYFDRITPKDKVVPRRDDDIRLIVGGVETWLTRLSTVSPLSDGHVKVIATKYGRRSTVTHVPLADAHSTLRKFFWSF